MSGIALWLWLSGTSTAYGTSHNKMILIPFPFGNSVWLHRMRTSIRLPPMLPLLLLLLVVFVLLTEAARTYIHIHTYVSTRRQRKSCAHSILYFSHLFIYFSWCSFGSFVANVCVCCLLSIVIIIILSIVALVADSWLSCYWSRINSVHTLTHIHTHIHILHCFGALTHTH